MLTHRHNAIKVSGMQILMYGLQGLPERVFEVRSGEREGERDEGRGQDGVRQIMLATTDSRMAANCMCDYICACMLSKEGGSICISHHRQLIRHESLPSTSCSLLQSAARGITGLNPTADRIVQHEPIPFNFYLRFHLRLHEVVASRVCDDVARV